jgi:TRAF-type zinc finger
MAMDNNDQMMSLMSSSFVTFEYMEGVEFVNDKLDDALICTICNQLLKYPMQCLCGDVFCRDCLDAMFSDDVSQVQCPCDENCQPMIKKDTALPDNAALRNIKRLHVRCMFKRFGCDETMQYSGLKKHVDVCTFGARCLNCGECIDSNMLNEHVTDICSKSVVSCQYNCGIPAAVREEMDLHVCPLKPRHCKFHHSGCNIELMDQEMVLHERDVDLHLDILAKHSKETELTVAQLQGKLDDALDANTQLKSLFERLENIVNDVMLRQQQQQQEDVSGKIVQLNNSIQNVDAKLSHIEGVMNTTEASFGAEASPTPSHSNLNDEIKKRVIAHDRALSVFEVRLSEFDLRLQCTETVSYNGTLLWNIGDFAIRRKQALDGQYLSLYSQPFYTSHHGYKMCARAYLNGDGIGRGRHLSLFFVVMQGDYDSILHWPFPCKVTISLMDQVHNMTKTDNKRGPKILVDSFKPDPSSLSFQKPTTPMNIASGCPLFVPLTTLENPNEPYLRNDMICIRVEVDINDIPPIV